MRTDEESGGPAPGAEDAEHAGDADENVSNAGRILEAAEVCFARFGFQKTSMEDIAREAGLSRRSVYRHFPDKSALFNEVVASRSRVYIEEIMRQTARLEGLSAQIEEVARLTIHYVREDPISAAMRLADPDWLARAVTTEGRQVLGMAMHAIVPLIEAARDRGEVRADLNVLRAAEWITRMVFSLCATPSVTFDIEDSEQSAEFIREFLLPGLR